MPKTLTKNPASSAKPKTLKARANSNGTKIPVRDTLLDETDPELLRAHRLLAKAAAAVRENLASMELESGNRA